MIRVGFDVSFAAPRPGASVAVTGVGRVIERVLVNLMQLPELDVRAVGCFQGDWNPVSTSILAERWTSSVTSNPKAAMPAYISRIGLLRLLAPLQLYIESAGNETPATFPLDVCAKLLRRVVRCDAKMALSPKTIDVFCATFLPPPTLIHPSIPRLVFIYDVYPARFPEDCGASACGTLQSTIKGLDFDRDVVVAISQFTKDDFCDLTQFPAERVVVAHLAAEDMFHPVSNSSSIARVRGMYDLGDTPFVLSVSNPQPRKNLASAIQAFDRVVRDLPEWKGNLVLAGNARVGWGTEAINAEINQFPATAGRIRRIGPVSEADLPVLYSEALAFVFPSKFEGFGLPVLEAMQCGTPVICSSTTSLPEVTGDAALHVDPTDVPAIASAMLRLISSEQERDRLSKLGLEQASRFSWSKAAVQVREAIQLAVRTCKHDY